MHVLAMGSIYTFKWATFPVVQMKKDDEARIAESIAKTLAMMCVRNTFLEDLHAGKSPVSNTGDFSDVKVIDANGQKIPWPDASRLNDEEMKVLMKQIVNRIYTFLLRSEDPQFQASVGRWMAPAEAWDKPELDEVFGAMIEELNSNQQS